MFEDRNGICANPPSSDDCRPRSWANDLPVEMIDTIVRHIDLFSTVRLAAVCKSWEKAVKTDPTLPFGRPCVLMTREFDENGYHDNYDEESVKLWDLTRESEDEVSRPALMWGAEQQRWVGGKDDWLATVDEYGNARLVNPYAGCQINLPDISTVVPAHAKTWNTFERIVVCETPYDASGTGYFVIAVVSRNILVIARGGDETWTALRNPEPDGYSWFHCSDAILHNGKVFAVDGSGSVYAWDIHASAIPDTEPELIRPPNIDDLLAEFKCWRLAESADGGRLLLVCIYGNEINCENAKGYRRSIFRFTGFHFHHEGVRLFERGVDAATGSSGDDDSDDGWSTVISLGDNSLFLGTNYPFLAPIDEWTSSGSLHHHQLQQNCVYVMSSESSECDMDMFDLGAEGKLCTSSKLYSDRLNRFQTPMWLRPIIRNYDIE